MSMLISNNFFETNFKFILAEFFLVSSVLLLILFGAFFTVSLRYKFPLIQLPVVYLSLLVLFFTSILVLNNNYQTEFIFNSTFVFDTFSQNGKFLLLFFALVYMLIITAYLNLFKINSFEYVLLLLLSLFGHVLLCSAFDLLSLYLAIELQSLALYTLAAFNKKSAYSSEAALKYFILGAISSGFLLFGISLIYGISGTINFEELRILMSLNLLDVNLTKIAIVFLCSALLFKISAAPFHIWIADVYEGAPITSTVFFATIPKIAVFFVTVRLFYTSFITQPEFWQLIFCLSSLLSVFIGSFLALKQRKIKRLFAFSSISNTGYIILSLSSCNVEGVHSAIMYIIFYAITALGLWAVILSTSCTKNFQKVLTLTEFISNKANPFLALSVLIFMFSLAGIPPLMGFFTKFFVIVAAIHSKLFICSVVVILSSVISTFYYLRVLKIIYFERVLLQAHKNIVPKQVAFLISIASSGLLVCFFYPEIIWLISYNTAQTLFF
uniref:NADH dehydrogenase subunit 2 n=1 Tax=Aureoumbra lagunensis TaxID=44058 RepID=A0A7U0QFU6_9STRA|nr:NADH dehydrogenase subunit 2 [Aureoumbra lagunensis]QQW50424.1 NADH dehydrogenase subunit 2 [Aureoumbra lagunensis]